MHSLGRELIVTEMHQSLARLHVRGSRSSAQRRGLSRTTADASCRRGFVKTSFS